jgi:hypothetical protein
MIPTPLLALMKAAAFTLVFCFVLGLLRHL